MDLNLPKVKLSLLSSGPSLSPALSEIKCILRLSGVRMSRGLPNIVRDNLEKARSSAIAAVTTYNSPGLQFKTSLFIVLIIISWTALFHAIFYKRRKKPWYLRRHSSGHRNRYIYVDGEPKHWDLAECLSQFYKDINPPERKNLEFLIGLRNKIEHRNLPDLSSTLCGECQASLMNLEEMLVAEFGQKYGLTEQLAISLQFSRVTPTEKKAAARRLATSEAKNVTDYIESFRGTLGSAVLDDQRYSFNVFLVPKVANRPNAADASVTFLNSKDLGGEEVSRLQKLNVLIKEKHIPIANLDYFKPGEVVARVAEKVPYRINMQTHTDAWRHFEIRPKHNSPDPANTKPEFCVYNKTHRDYLFTKAWIDKLINDLSDPESYRKIMGKDPQPIDP